MSETRADRVRQIVADILDVDVSAVSLASSPDTIESWDSMQHLNLVLALEQTFGVTFVPEEIDTMTTVGRIVDVVDAKAPARRPV
jgi:acyl carrier protein